MDTGILICLVVCGPKQKNVCIEPFLTGKRIFKKAHTDIYPDDYHNKRNAEVSCVDTIHPHEHLWRRASFLSLSFFIKAIWSKVTVHPLPLQHQRVSLQNVAPLFPRENRTMKLISWMFGYRQLYWKQKCASIPSRESRARFGPSGLRGPSLWADAWGPCLRRYGSNRVRGKCKPRGTRKPFFRSPGQNLWAGPTPIQTSVKLTGM